MDKLKAVWAFTKLWYGKAPKLVIVSGVSGFVLGAWLF